MGKASRRRAAGNEIVRENHTRHDTGGRTPFVARPFEGLTGETDWVAMREVVPAATAGVTFSAGVVAADCPQTAIMTTVLPLAWSGLRRTDGAVMAALQSGSTTGDASRDVAQVLLAVAAADPGTPLPSTSLAPPATPRLQDVIDPSAAFEVTVHEGFDYWVADADDLDEEGKESLDQANASVIPTTKLKAAPSAYWCRVGERTYLRWVLPQNEDDATNALARLHAAATTSLGEGTRLLGAFRSCGLLVPVWDLDPSLVADDYEGEVAQMAVRLDEALAEAGTPLSAQERRARSGLLSRQVTLR